VKNLLLAVAFVACAIGGFFLADGNLVVGIPLLLVGLVLAVVAPRIGRST
jgi:4-hydroxybenzoate polyprenyltransferase